jgi:hypothetical protein
MPCQLGNSTNSKFMKTLYLYLTNQFHPGSLIVLIALDLLWSVIEGGLAATGIGLLLYPLLMLFVFIICFPLVTSIQKFSFYDDWPAALAKGFAFGVVAALPFSFISLFVAAAWGLLHLLYGADEEVILLGKLTRGWREIELALQRLGPPEIRHWSTEDIINYLYSKGVLSPAHTERLHELRKLRNAAVHEVNSVELSSLVDAVLLIRDNLKRRYLQ